MHKPLTVFFGSGPVALRSLQLLKDHFTFEAIVTKPTTTCQMQTAAPGVPVHAVQRRAELDLLLDEHQFMSTFAILIDFGIIVSEQVINRFPKGIINSHFSLLPQWRGADPITFAILSGQPQTGVSLMLLNSGLDEGMLIAQAPYNISANATTASLTEGLVDLSAQLLIETLPKYLSGGILPYPQQTGSTSNLEPSYSRKLTKEDGLIDWRKPAAVLEREIRAYGTWPHSYTTLASKDVTITSAQVADMQGEAGAVHATKNKLYVYCGKQALEIITLKPAGKKEMTAAAFLAGYGRLLQA